MGGMKRKEEEERVGEQEDGWEKGKIEKQRDRLFFSPNSPILQSFNSTSRQRILICLGHNIRKIYFKNKEILI